MADTGAVATEPDEPESAPKGGDDGAFSLDASPNGAPGEAIATSSATEVTSSSTVMQKGDVVSAAEGSDVKADAPGEFTLADSSAAADGSQPTEAVSMSSPVTAALDDAAMENARRESDETPVSSPSSSDSDSPTAADAAAASAPVAPVAISAMASPTSPSSPSAPLTIVVIPPTPTEGADGTAAAASTETEANPASSSVSSPPRRGSAGALSIVISKPASPPSGQEDEQSPPPPRRRKRGVVVAAGEDSEHSSSDDEERERRDSTSSVSSNDSVLTTASPIPSTPEQLQAAQADDQQQQHQSLAEEKKSPFVLPKAAATALSLFSELVAASGRGRRGTQIVMRRRAGSREEEGENSDRAEQKEDDEADTEGTEEERDEEFEEKKGKREDEEEEEKDSEPPPPPVVLREPPKHGIRKGSRGASVQLSDEEIKSLLTEVEEDLTTAAASSVSTPASNPPSSSSSSSSAVPEVVPIRYVYDGKHLRSPSVSLAFAVPEGKKEVMLAAPPEDGSIQATSVRLAIGKPPDAALAPVPVVTAVPGQPLPQLVINNNVLVGIIAAPQSSSSSSSSSAVTDGHNGSSSGGSTAAAAAAGAGGEHKRRHVRSHSFALSRESKIPQELERIIPLRRRRLLEVDILPVARAALSSSSPLVILSSASSSAHTTPASSPRGSLAPGALAALTAAESAGSDGTQSLTAAAATAQPASSAEAAAAASTTTTPPRLSSYSSCETEEGEVEGKDNSSSSGGDLSTPAPKKQRWFEKNLDSPTSSTAAVVSAITGSAGLGSSNVAAAPVSTSAFSELDAIPAPPSALATKGKHKKNKKTVSFAEELVVPLSPAEYAPSSKKQPKPAPNSPPRSILRRSVRWETYAEALMRVIMERQQEEERLLQILQKGAQLIKYGTDGKPKLRWFYVSEDGADLIWRKKPLEKHQAARAKNSLLPSFRLGKWKVGDTRSRPLADVLAVLYGPYSSRKNFKRYIERQDGASGEPWLCFSVRFPDRSLDILCKDEQEVTDWFLGIQALAPVSQFYLTRGGLLWQRCIMKLNMYGLEAVTKGIEYVRNRMSRQRRPNAYVS